MEQVVRNLLRRLFPSMEAGTVHPRFGVVTRIPAPVQEGQIADDAEPHYAVDVQMLTLEGQPDGPVYQSVPLPVPMAGHGRGSFGFPQEGTRVLVQFVEGSPSHPVITGIYPAGRHLPGLLETETLLQHSQATFLRSSKDEDWQLQARNKMWIGNSQINLIAEVRRLSEWARDHKHPAHMREATTNSAAGEIAGKVQSIEK